MTNLSIFERNVIHAFQAYDLTNGQLDDAEKMFLNHGANLAAERETLKEIEQWEKSNLLIPLAVRIYKKQGMNIDDSVSSSLTAFQRDTSYRKHYPLRLKTPWKHWRDC